MTYQQPNGRPFTHFVEDGGLAALMGNQQATLARETALNDPEVLQAVREVLKVAFADEQRKRFLDPFAAPTSATPRW